MTIAQRAVSLETAASAGDFVKLAQVMLHAKCTNESALRTAEVVRASDRVQRVLKAAIPAGSVADPEWAGDVAGLQNLADAFAESLKNISVFDRLMSDAAFLPVPLRQRVGIVLSGASAGVVGDGSAKPLSRLQLAAPLLELRKAAGIIVVSDELAKANSKTANALIARELRSAVAAATNQFFLETLTEGTSVTSIDSSGSDPDAIAFDIRRLLAAVQFGANARLYFVSSPSVARLGGRWRDRINGRTRRARSAAGNSRGDAESVTANARPCPRDS